MSKSKDKHPKTKPVIVRWVDSMKNSGWRDYESSGLECTTIGHLVSRTKERVAVCMNRSKYGDGDYMEIPMCSVKSIRRLKE